MTHTDTPEVPVKPLIRSLLRELERPGDAPGAVAAAGVAAAMAAALGRAASLTLRRDDELDRTLDDLLAAIDLDTRAYRAWTRGHAGEIEHASSPSRVGDIAARIDVLLDHIDEEGTNLVDIAVARTLARAASTAASLVADGNQGRLAPNHLVPEALARTPRGPSNSDDLVATARNRIWLPGNPSDAGPLFRARSARGCWIEDDEGHHWLDATSGMWNVPLGHGRPEVLQAFTEQALVLASLDPFQVTSRIAETAAEVLCRYTGWPGGRVLFSSSGSEAVETALRIGLMVRGPEAQIAALPGAFHGCTAGAAVLSGHRSVYAPYNGRFQRAASSTPGAWPPGGVGFIEAYQGAGGGQALDVSEREAIVAFRASGGILVADEVACGLGRCASPVAAIELGLEPDIVLFGKGLANGVSPISAVLLGERIVEAMGDRPLEDGHTHSNHPPSLAAAAATLRIMETERTHRAAALLERRLRAKLERHGVDLLGVGALLAVPLGSDVPRERLLAGLRSTRLMIHAPTSAERHERLVVAPPLTMDHAEIDELARRLVALKEHCIR